MAAATDSFRRGDLTRKGIVFVISSVSGGGKTTLINRILAVLPGLALSVSHTTRRPRTGEREGVEYFFVSEARFRDMVRQGLFLEWARVHGNLYGTSAEAVSGILESGKDVLLDIDVQGALQIKEQWPSCVMIFIVPPSGEELKRRLAARGTETAEQIEQRLSCAERELALLGHYDYAVLNEDLEEAVQNLRSVIVAERCRILPSGIWGKPQEDESR